MASIVDLRLNLTSSIRFVGRICSAIYGLVEAPSSWHKNVQSTFLDFRLTPLYSEGCIFCKSEEETLVISLYVDDVIFKGIELDNESISESYAAELRDQDQRVG